MGQILSQILGVLTLNLAETISFFYKHNSSYRILSSNPNDLTKAEYGTFWREILEIAFSAGGYNAPDPVRRTQL